MKQWFWNVWLYCILWVTTYLTSRHDHKVTQVLTCNGNLSLYLIVVCMIGFQGELPFVILSAAKL